ncbi:hypothetical protein VCV18_001421 [Metarhizium anisopliae]
MEESNPRPGNDLESPTAQRRSSTPAVSPQHSTRVASWTQSERGLQQSLSNSAEKLVRANMSAETLIQPENALPEGALRAPGTLVTILASTFLPASLAVGCLSMNTRFAKLGGMLFDLLGVIVLIGGFAVVSVAVIRIWIRARSHGPWKTKTQRARSIKSKARVWIIVSCLYLLVTASLLIIMLGNYLVGGVTFGVTAALSLVGFALYLLR